MSAEIVDTRDEILTLKVSGKLTQPEMAAVQEAAADILKQQPKTRILVVAENFQGWERGGKWGDLSFPMENDPRIEKMAIVGEKRWEDLALMFVSKGFRKFPIEYFQPPELARAKEWLAAN